MILAEELDEVLMFIDIRVSKNTNQVRANWRRVMCQIAEYSSEYMLRWSVGSFKMTVQRIYSSK